MEGLIRLMHHATGTSVRTLIRWTDMFLLNPRGWELERALVPLGHHHASLPPLPLADPEDFEDTDMNDKKYEGFLWGVPKKRTSQMKRLRRKFGHQDYAHVSGIMRPKTTIRICDTCGHHYEAKCLCGNCYDKIKAETQIIRDSIQTNFGDSAEDKSVVIMYETEKEQLGKEATDRWNDNNVLIEIPKPRPAWFSSNLLQKSTAGINTTDKALTPQTPTPTIVSSSKSSD